MNREIKFRAWDDFKKEMFQLLNNPISELNQAGLPIMQYTGLKDKNGKEIYEGDVVKVSEVYRGERTDYFYKIVWHYEKFIAVREDEFNEENSMGILFNKEFMEVVGNIYENSNLIN